MARTCACKRLGRAPRVRAIGERAPQQPTLTAVAGNIVAGFEVTYDFGSQEALVTAIHNRGVLVIHSYHRFNDGSGRSNFISKEFFHQ